MTQLSVEEAQGRLRELLQAALGGDEIVIGDNGHAVRLVPVPDEPRTNAEGEKQLERRPRFGSAKGIVLYMADDFDAPLEEFKEYME